MDDQIGAKIERSLQNRRAEAVIDTDQNTPCACAIATRAAISAISVSGFDGVSRKKSLVSGRIAACHAATSVWATKLVPIPKRGRMVPSNCWVAPNKPVEATM
jgi:hypothetical protein